MSTRLALYYNDASTRHATQPLPSRLFSLENMTVATVSRIYADACEQRGPEYYQYNDFRPIWRSPEPYEIIKKIGRGKYSDVFLAYNTTNQQLCVIKVLKPVKKQKIRREISVLEHLAGGPNILQLMDTVRDPVTKIPALVTEAVDARDFRQLFQSFTDTNVRFYMLHLLYAIDYCHEHGIMHRDLKPHNIMIDHKQKQLRLIDFGLAEYYHPGTQYNVRVASRHYKGPELLVEFKTYDYSLDIWSFACTMAAIIFRFGEPFFRGNSNRDQLLKIVEVLGSEAFEAYVAKYHIDIPPSLASIYAGKNSRPLSEFITPENRHLAVPEALDLLDHCLRFDHMERYTARECIQHSFFDPVREEVQAQVAAQIAAHRAENRRLVRQFMTEADDAVSETTDVTVD